MVTQVEEIEVILYRDFYFKVLPKLGLKQLLADPPGQHAKLDMCLGGMGALALVQINNDFAKVIRLEVLIAAMGANKYIYSKTNKGGVHQLSLKSTRVMNRLVGRLFVRYHDANKQKMQNEIESAYAQVI